ncbi:MAG: DoxX family protein [Candidatus Paceibacterota bacterium]
MEINIFVLPFLQIIIAFGLINVWILRFSMATKYRGAGAKNMQEEFSAYGLPVWFMYIVGFLKLAISLVMILGLFSANILALFGLPALAILAILMLGAIGMHIKVRDSFVKSIPAILMLSMTVLGLYLSGNF